ncbi:MAG: AMP-binding protein [Lachnospiraceae bacterium]|nr:AMP-binding protein [Lachnospiraceae bacterium]MDD3616020.1 AMP-binding protein [Lachnospiraceae bacterium]
MNRLYLLYMLLHMRRNVRKSKDKIEKLQTKKLRKMIKYAYTHSEYYRDSFQKAGLNKKNISTVSLSELPTINKEQLLENYDRLITAKDITQNKLLQFDENKSKNSLYKNQYHMVHSSGSTGIPRYFIYDQKAWSIMLAGIIRGALWGMSNHQILKLLAGKPKILYIAATDGRYGGAMAVGDGIHGVGASQKFLDINTPLTEWSKCMDEYKPDLIIGYPSAIKILGELIEKEQLEVSVKRVISCGEPLDRGLKEYLQKTFRAEIINFYGASESLAIGVEGNTDKEMILFDDMNMIEVVDGNMYLTCLYNYTQPLIRYQISDQLVLHKDEKLDVTSFTKADVLMCRNEEILWFMDKDGKRDFLHPLSVEGFCIHGLIDYQFKQISDTAFEIYAEIGVQADEEAIKTEIKTQMEKILNGKNITYVTFEIKFVEQILPDSKTGKKSLIIKPERR